jgi:iron complex outermembrane receptor protein/vitamin B12 transporter
MIRFAIRGALLLVLLAGLVPKKAFGQSGSSDEPILMPEIPVSASRLGLRLDETAASTERLDRAEIESLAPASTADLFRGLSGVQVDGGDAGPAYLHVRGADPNMTLVIVDGVAVNDPTDARGGAFDLRDLDPSEIQSIEVVRGPVSAVHGSDALAGVIQIVTRSVANRAWGRAEVGDFGYRSAVGGAGAVGRFSSWNVRGQIRDEGMDIAGQERRSRGGGAKGHLQVGDRTPLRWSLEAGSTHELRYREDSGGLRYAVGTPLESQDEDRLQWMAHMETPLSSSLGWTGSFSGLNLDRHLDSPAIAPGVRDGVPATTSDDELRRRNLAFDLRWRPGPEQVALVGTEVEFEDGHSRGTLDQGFLVPTNFDRTRRTASFFAEASRMVLDGLTVESALRWDAIEDLRPEFTARTGLGWRPESRDLRLHLSWAQGFKAPSFFAVAHPLVGNPDLEPERSENVEAGISYRGRSGRWDVGVVGFVTDYTDLIDFDAMTFRMVNRDAVDVHGVELRGRFDGSRGWSAAGQFQYTHNRIRATGLPLQDRPELTSTLDLIHRWKDAGDLRLRLIHQGRVPDSSVPTGNRDRKAFVRLDLAGHRRLGNDLSLVVGVENLLDTDYSETIGIPGRGRFARIGIRVER